MIFMRASVLPRKRETLHTRMSISTRFRTQHFLVVFKKKTRCLFFQNGKRYVRLFFTKLKKMCDFLIPKSRKRQNMKLRNELTDRQQHVGTYQQRIFPPWFFQIFESFIYSNSTSNDSPSFILANQRLLHRYKNSNLSSIIVVREYCTSTCGTYCDWFQTCQMKTFACCKNGSFFIQKHCRSTVHR